MEELRWILLVLGILTIGGIWLWTARGSRQAPGNAELREPTVTPVHTPSSALSDSSDRLPDRSADRRDPLPERREWGISPLEPLSIRTADFSEVPALDQPMLTHADPVDFSQDASRASVPRAAFERTIEVDLTGVEPPSLEPAEAFESADTPEPSRQEPPIEEPPIRSRRRRGRSP